MKYSFILPCRNEEQTLGACISKIREAMTSMKETDYEIIVSDSSTDKSPEIARAAGATLVKHDMVGYGNAYIQGLNRATGDILILGDADDTYDFREVQHLLPHMNNHDLVLGRRVHIAPGAMPWLHRYVGNPVLSGILRMLFHVNVRDSHSGLRVMRRLLAQKLNLRTIGMEFASEMIIKSAKAHARIKEVPIHYYPRLGQSKLQSFPDGWKHLRFMLLYSPNFLFLLPGLLLFCVGSLAMILLYFGSVAINNVHFYYHPLFIAALFILLGIQLCALAVFTKTYAITHLGERSRLFEILISKMTLERSLFGGSLVVVTGLAFGLYILLGWIRSGYSALAAEKEAIIMLTLIFAGTQLIFNAFMTSILGIKER